MKKVISMVALSMLLGLTAFSASSLTRNTEGNFSVDVKYYDNFSGQFTSVWSNMKNYDADGYYGNAHVTLQEDQIGVWVNQCSANDSKLEVNETVKCSTKPDNDFEDYRTRAYYSTINGSSNTNDQVYTILS